MSWRDAYRHGTLLLLPPEPLRATLDPLRRRHDPASAQMCTAHITLTQPFVAPLSDADVHAIAEVVRGHAPFDVVLGPVERLAPDVVVLRVEPRHRVLSLRQRLHALGLFDLSLPFTEGFVPHLTLSERGLVEPLPPLPAASFPCASVHHLVPDDDFVFGVRQVFALGSYRGEGPKRS